MVKEWNFGSPSRISSVTSSMVEQAPPGLLEGLAELAVPVGVGNDLDLPDMSCVRFHVAGLPCDNTWRKRGILWARVSTHFYAGCIVFDSNREPRRAWRVWRECTVELGTFSDIIRYYSQRP